MPYEGRHMTYSGFHLAQVNIGRARGAMDEPVMAGFAAQLDTINGLADRDPGFVWRLQTEDGDATAIRPYDDERIMINLSVWADLASLRSFVFSSHHTGVMRQRREWFERFPKAYVALWWISAGHRPTVAEAVARLEHLQAHGPTPHAFSFREPFDPEGRPLERDSQWNECPTA
jgi:uncharacterized protein DUF3291